MKNDKYLYLIYREEQIEGIIRKKYLSIEEDMIKSAQTVFELNKKYEPLEKVSFYFETIERDFDMIDSRKTCIFCDKGLRRKEQKYCSKLCVSKHRELSRTIQCKGCGNTVTLGPRKKRNKTQLYCSRECYSKHVKKPLKKTCEFCNKQLKPAHTRYCSVACRSKHLELSRVIECKGCHAKVTLKPRYKRKNIQQYCSKECYVKNRPSIPMKIRKITQKYINQKKCLECANVFPINEFNKNFCNRDHRVSYFEKRCGWS